MLLSIWFSSIDTDVYRPSFHRVGTNLASLSITLYSSSVTEELLIEAHDEEEPTQVISAFFIGFFFVLLLELRERGHLGDWVVQSDG